MVEHRQLAGDLPLAMSSLDSVRANSDRMEIFLDYDGTLTPLVDHPSDATLHEQSRSVLDLLSQTYPVAIVSGRSAADVRELVALSALTYVGSHGHEIIFPEGGEYEHQESTRVVDALKYAESALRRELGGLPGVLVERKPFALAVHTRLVSEQGVIARVAEAVRLLVADIEGLKVTTGSDVWEVRPDVDWHKGSAVEMLLSDPKAMPLFIGDDTTDEDGFTAATRHGGVGIIVQPEPDRLTSAQLRLTDPAEVIQFLALL